MPGNGDGGFDLHFRPNITFTLGRPGNPGGKGVNALPAQNRVGALKGPRGGPEAVALPGNVLPSGIHVLLAVGALAAPFLLDDSDSRFGEDRAGKDGSKRLTHAIMLLNKFGEGLIDGRLPLGSTCPR
eukprot:2868966-Alexandrium_andersonii.AAC.1